MTFVLQLPDHFMSLIPGDEYISSCLWPLRNRYSMVLKSFLSRPMAFSNSVLHLTKINSIPSRESILLNGRKMSPTHLAYFSKCGLAFKAIRENTPNSSYGNTHRT